jgi:hypothetical protein
MAKEGVRLWIGRLLGSVDKRAHSPGYRAPLAGSLLQKPVLLLSQVKLYLPHGHVVDSLQRAIMLPRWI